MARSMFISGKSLAQLARGKWYFGFICKGCGKRFALIEDTKEGRAPLDLGEIRVRTACPHCHAHNHSYRADEVQCFEHALKA
jgi:hypothetical protein